jgi:hypothetical protein
MNILRASGCCTRFRRKKVARLKSNRLFTPFDDGRTHTRRRLAIGVTGKTSGATNCQLLVSDLVTIRLINDRRRIYDFIVRSPAAGRRSDTYLKSSMTESSRFSRPSKIKQSRHQVAGPGSARLGRPGCGVDRSRGGMPRGDCGLNQQQTCDDSSLDGVSDVDVIYSDYPGIRRHYDTCRLRTAHCAVTTDREAK